MSGHVDLTVLRCELVKLRDLVLEKQKKFENNDFYFDQVIYEVWASNIILAKIDFAIASNIPLESVDTFFTIDGKVDFKIKK
jgi:hypothetical protein